MFGATVLLSTVALVVGLLRGYPTGDVFGDYYKFIIPAATVTLVYAVADSSEQLETALAVAFRIGLLLIASVLTLYVTGVLGLNDRPRFIYQFPILIVLGYWQYRQGDPVARYGFPFLVVATLPLVGYSQSLSLLLQTLLTAVLAVTYARFNSPRELAVGGGVVAVVGVIGGGLLLLAATQLSSAQWREYGYLGSKMVALVGDYTLYERLIVLGGSRAAEPFGVLARIDGGLLELLVGSGMGSTFMVSSPFGSPRWIGEDHFVHAGLWEAVLRTGLLGGLAYLGVVVSYIYVGWKVSGDSYLGALAAANASTTLLFAPLVGKLLGPQFFSYALFAYALVRWGELRDCSEKLATTSDTCR
ncbi:hypothetical protein [Halosegnis marinus]|uniref:hypothetical protein n=1 Tax=Halosegnis marinus TaxID=3034023 RepID=UPI003609EC5B